MYALLVIHTGNVYTLNYLHNLVCIVISAYRDNVCPDSYLHYIVCFLDYSSMKQIFNNTEMHAENRLASKLFTALAHVIKQTNKSNST